MSEPHWLATAAELATVQDAASLHDQILEIALRDPFTDAAALYVDDMGVLTRVAGSEAPEPRDPPESGATTADGWRWIALTSAGVRTGVLAVQRSSVVAVEAVADHIGAALSAASTYAMLEDLVQQEMSTAIAREQSIQLILDNMNEGLFVVDLTGVATEVRSRAVSEWLGDIPEAEPVWDWLAADDALAATLATNFQQIAWDALPFEVTASQMPDRIRREDRTYGLGYSQVFEDGSFTKVLVTLRDITAELQAERDEAARKEMERVVRTLLANVEGFREGLHEMQRLLADLADTDAPSLRARVLHTIKGSGAILGFTAFAAEVHAVEDILADDPEAWGPALRARIDKAWSTSFDFVRPLVAGDDAGVSLQAAEYERFTEMLQVHQVPTPIVQAAQSWSSPSLAGTFDRFQRLVHRFCARTGKQVTCTLHGESVRIRGEGQSSVIATFVHLLRNAMDHGFEHPGERRAAGKPETGTLTIRAEDLGDRLRITFTDDGRGIDIARVRQNARQRGLPSNASLVDCISSGSTKEEATLTSGRGVGMAAVRDAVVGLGGTIDVETEQGVGTTFVIDLPTVALVPG